MPPYCAASTAMSQEQRSSVMTIPAAGCLLTLKLDAGGGLVESVDDRFRRTELDPRDFPA
jgi:hypothetical protein